MRNITPHAASLLAAMCLLAGCASADRYSAAGDVYGFLVAVRDDDRAAFDAHVDRAALRAQLQSRLVDETRAAHPPSIVTATGLLMSGPASDLAGAVLLRPEVFRAVAEYYGYKPDAPLPGRVAIASAVQSTPDGRVCASAKRHGRCLLLFANEGGVWRLVGFEGDAAMLRLPAR